MSSSLLGKYNIELYENLTDIFSVMMLALSLFPFILITINARPTSIKPISSSFYVIPLGTSGGLDENNLSAYLLTSVNDNIPNSAYISLDGGTIRHGLE